MLGAGAAPNERTRRGRWWRHGLALTATTCLLGAVIARPGRAEEAPAAEIVLGTGKATAGLLQPALTAGELKVNVVVGEASSSYQDESARASSTSLDVPILRAASGGTVCGQAGVDIGAFLPPAVSADTAPNGNTKPVSASSPPEADLVLGQRAAAEPGSKASSRTVLAHLATGLVDLDGLEAVTHVGVDPATATRTASASTKVAQVRLLGGLVRIEGPAWSLQQQQVGPDSRNDQRTVDGSFDLGAIVISPSALLGQLPQGIPGLGALLGSTDIRLPLLPSESADELFVQVNQILGPLGVQIRLPKLTNPAGTDRHELSALQIVLGGPDFVLAPVLGQLLNNPDALQIQSTLLKTLFDPTSCEQLGGLMQGIPELNSLYNTLGSYAPILLAVGTGVLSGGEVQINIGGVATELDDTYYPPLGFGGPVLNAPSLPGTAPVAPAVTPGSSPGSPPVAPSEEITTTPASLRCATTSPAGRPGCWLGNARAAVAIAGITTLALLAADEVVRRRRTTASPPTDEVPA